MGKQPFTWSHDHIHLRCRDIEASASFYERLFDAQLIRRPGPNGPSLIEVRWPSLTLFLSPPPAPAPLTAASPELGMWQISFRVHDLDEALAKLRTLGAVFSRPAVTLASGARAAFLDAPDGVEIELIQRVSQGDPAVGHATSDRRGA